MRISGHAAVARTLDNYEEVVREHYSHIEASELGEQMTNAFEEADQQGRTAANGNEIQLSRQSQVIGRNETVPR